MPSMKGATLAEVIVGMLVFSLFALAVLGMLAMAADLNQRDTEINQVNQLSQGLMEEAVMAARSQEGYQQLRPLGLRPCADPRFLYALEVEEQTDGPEVLGLKKVSVLLYYTDPANPTVPDPRRPLATCLGTQVEAP